MSARIARVDSFTSEGMKAVLDDGRRLTLSAGASAPLIELEPRNGDGDRRERIRHGLTNLIVTPRVFQNLAQAVAQGVGHWRRIRADRDIQLATVSDAETGRVGVVNAHGLSSRVGDSAAATADVVEPTLGDALDTSSLSGGVSGAPSGGAA